MRQTTAIRPESKRSIIAGAADPMIRGLVHGIMLSAILWAAVGWAWLLLR